MNEGETHPNEGLVRELLVTALDGDATDAELRQLNDALRSDESLRRSTHRFLSDDALLAEEIGTLDEALNILKISAEQLEDKEHRQEKRPVPERQVAGRVSSKKQSADDDFTATANGGLQSIFRLVNRHGLAVAALALFVLAGIGWHHLRLLSEFDRLHTLAAAPDSAEQKQASIKSQRAGIMPSSTSVARATAVVDCEWFDRSSELKFGDELSPGQKIRLRAGLLQLTFATGAKVVVEGPADFVATTATEAVLTEGKIAAAVPRFARGYTILTPTAEIVDLGTEFGVNVDQKGNSEVHVFDGDVVARPRENGVAQGELLHAQQDEAIQFAAAKAGQRISADSSKFKRRLTPGRPADELPPLPVTHDLALWLAADVMPIKEPETPVATWPDVLVGDNQFPDDAWQFNERICPKWVRDANGLPAVRFDGWSTFLATSPMATSDRQTAFVVFAPGPTSFAMESHGAMLLKYGLDTPSLELALLPDFSPRAWIWASNDDGSTSNVGVLRGPQVKPHVPCAVAYIYDAVSDRSEMLLNGQVVASDSAPKPLEQQARKYIGAHAQPWMETYFLGNMYEILVYDTALDQADCGRMFEYLSKRYGFSLTER